MTAITPREAHDHLKAMVMDDPFNATINSRVCDLCDAAAMLGLKLIPASIVVVPDPTDSVVDPYKVEEYPGVLPSSVSAGRDSGPMTWADFWQ